MNTKNTVAAKVYKGLFKCTKRVVPKLVPDGGTERRQETPA